MEVESLLSLRETADALGVSRQKVQQLVSQGRLPALRIGASWHVNVADVSRFQSAARHSGRPLAAAAAWSVLADAEQTGIVELPRGRAERDVFWLTNLTRRRATVHRLQGLDMMLDALENDVVAAGETAARAHQFAPGGSVRVIDGYIKSSKLARLIKRYGLVDGRGPDLNVILRVVDENVWPFPKSTKCVSRLVAALDMLDTPIDDRSVDAATPIVQDYL